MKKLNNKAFTIIEILLVVVIIGILAGLVLNVVTSLDERAEATDAAARLEQTRKSAIAAAINSERSSWWTEDTLEACSTGSETSDPYVDEIAAGCDEVNDFLQSPNLKLEKDTVRIRYDNDQDGSPALLSTCGGAGGGVNVYADFDNEMLIDVIDKKIDNSDGSDCGRFRWDSGSGQIYYLLSGDETSLQ